MKHVLEIRPATLSDAYELSRTLRQLDLDEIIATSGREPVEVLSSAINDSTNPKVATVDGSVMCVWGVVPIGCVGTVWLLTSNLIEKYPKLFWKACRDEIDAIRSEWPLVFNFIDCRHKKAIRWANRLGFRMDEPAPYGALGLPFRKVTITRGF